MEKNEATSIQNFLRGISNGLATTNNILKLTDKSFRRAVLLIKHNV